MKSSRRISPNWENGRQNGKYVSDQKRDLGVLVDSSINVSTQCAAAMKKANSMLGIIKKGTENKTANLLVPLYKMLVRPHLEYCVPFWSPLVKKRQCVLQVRNAVVMLFEIFFSNLQTESKNRDTGDVSFTKNVFTK